MKLLLRAPHQKYFTKDGVQRVGVTTVLNVFAKDAIPPWYAAMERDGIVEMVKRLGAITYEGLVASLPQDTNGKPRWFAITKRDTAADLGTVAHAHIEAKQIGETLDRDGLDPKMYEDALIPAGRFFGWVERERVTLVAAEKQMVSEHWQVGGTGDGFWRGPDGKLEYWDVKTSKPWKDGHPYDEQIAQSAAYADFYEELEGEHVERIRIARVGKTLSDEGDLFPLTDAMRACGMILFRDAVSSYNIKQQLGRMFK